MTHAMPNLRFFVTAALIMLGTISVLITYARACLCDGCPNGFALWLRGERQLCRECKNIEDRRARRLRRPPLTIPRRPWKDVA